MDRSGDIAPLLAILFIDGFRDGDKELVVLEGVVEDGKMEGEEVGPGRYGKLDTDGEACPDCGMVKEAGDAIDGGSLGGRSSSEII